MPSAANPTSPLSWEQFRDHLQLTNLESLERTPLGTSDGYAVDFLWTIVAAILVFWMQAGFAMVESGFTRPKNAVNIFMKNVVDFSMGSVAFWAVGFGLMFGTSNGLFGTTDFAPSGDITDNWVFAFLMFQTVFCATAATIVSGAMAERTRFPAYIVYSLVISALIYPIFGSWAWGSLFHGQGWLEAPEQGLLAELGLPAFVDFAGSTVVHSVGGWAALAGTLVLGPRRGKYDGTGLPIRGHSMALATIGVFVLWMGWFGFNAGSTTAVVGGGGAPFAGAGKSFALIAVNTNLAACAGALGAMFSVWRTTGKPDIGMTLNGVLGGLVAITAPCASVTPASALAIGAVAGVLVVFFVNQFERARIDDPVGAISVHGVCGVWGTVSVALFQQQGFSVLQLASQCVGAVTAFWWSFGCAYVLFRVVAATMGLRVSAEEEDEGLDIGEHGAEAYPSEESLVPVAPLETASEGVGGAWPVPQVDRA